MRCVEEGAVLPVAREVLRRRLMQGGMVPKLSTIATQVALRYSYDGELGTGDLTSWMQVRPVSDDGEILNVVSGRDPFRVYQAGSGCVHVFSTYAEGVIIFMGWLPDPLVQECPVTNRGADTDEYHEVDALLLAPMPDTLSFTETCDHTYGVWDTAANAWDCVCGRFIPSARDRAIATGALELVAAPGSSTS